MNNAILHLRDQKLPDVSVSQRKGILFSADIPTIFQDKIDRTLGHQTPVWLVNIIIVTRETKEQKTTQKVPIPNVLTKLRNQGRKGQYD